MNHVVIMAGGVGSRFWPMSTPEKPKQFIDILGVGRTLLQLTAERFEGICPPQNIWVVTSVRYRNLVKEQLPAIPDSNILLEPCMRNTAPCIAYAAWKIKKKDPEADLVVTAADHWVTDACEFRRVVAEGLAFVEGGERILTLGMLPTRPETGYGYIKVGGDAETEKGEVRKVEAFKEKPDLSTAKAYLSAGGYYWNAGIFLWNVKTLEAAFRKHEPEIASLFDSLENVLYTPEEQQVVDAKFPSCKNISVDYAVMERAANVYVLPANFGWSDLGTWGALYEQLPKESGENAVVGNARLIESRKCVVHVSADKKILIQGLEDYIVAEQDGVILICKKADEQRIREFSADFR